ncbi:MAG: YCF48-related protein, partial [Thermoanaerobaculia bacterium]|nr:YCF48-related protein [Thermoanaerobaculia bacterium]
HLTRKHAPYALSKALLVFAFFALIPDSIFAQWVAQTSGTTNHVLGIHFVDPNTGYAVGGHVQNNTGAILKTTDAGQTWAIENTTPQTTSRLYRLSLPNATTGYACGLDGTILKFPDDPPCNNTFIQSLTNMGGSRPNIFPHPNGDFFATGLRNDSTVIVRFDPGGVPQWARAFRLGGDMVQISDMFVDTVSGDLFGVAYPQVFVQSELRGVAFRYNMASHTFVWVQYIPSAANTQIHALDAQTCVLTGITSGGYTHLMRLDKNTGAINGYDLAGDSGDYYSTLFNGTLYGTCRRYYDGFQASVFAHDPNSGAFLWQNTIISNNGPNSTRMYPVKPVVDNDGITVLASGDLDGFNVYLDGPVELVVAKTSLTGDVVWTKQYVVGGFDRPWATAIVPTATGYYIVANLYQPALSDFAYSVLIKTDKQGQVQWAKRLGISGRNIARNVMERNGFLYLTMASDSYAFNDLLLIKLDQNGETELDCDFTQPISVDVIDLPNIQNAQNYTVFDHGMALVPLDAIPAETGSQTVTYCSTPCLCPDLPISAGSDTTICAGRSILLQATPGFDTYLWSPATGLNDPASPNPVASPATTTTYTLVATKTVPDLPVCVYTDSVTVTVNPTDSTIFTFTRCANEPIEINGELVTTDQVFTQYFANISGCDSVVITYVKFVPLPARAENISFCAGASVVIGGNTYTQAGTVLDTIPGTTGCDTVVTYTLTILPLLTR